LLESTEHAQFEGSQQGLVACQDPSDPAFPTSRQLLDDKRIEPGQVDEQGAVFVKRRG